MSYLIDTDILIYSLKKHPVVQMHFKAKANIPKSISVISYGELIFGAQKSPYKEKNLATAHRIAEIFPIIPVNKAIIEAFGNFKAVLQTQGRNFSDLDLIIGSTAVTMNYILVTSNVRHFNNIPGIQLENWADR